MRKLILGTAIAVTAMFMGVQPAEAKCCKSGIKLCIKKKVCTEEICRRYFCKTKCVLGCPKTIKYVEITYRTTYRDCCGRCSYKTYKVTRRCW